LIPDDNPGAGHYLTLKDIESMLAPYMAADENLDQALWMLETNGRLALDGKKGFRIAFLKEGHGLYLCYLNENVPDE
jgi:hypothetical protein